MFKDLIIVPNFFDNPNEIVKIAKSNKFYSHTEHPQDKNTNIYYGGKRSEVIDEYTNNILMDTFIRKVVLSDIPKDTQRSATYNGKGYFHYFPKEYIGGQTQIHQDSDFLSAVIYLSDKKLENPEKHGTIVFNQNEQSFVMPYSYNTLIMYRSDFMHAPLAGFGDTEQDGRLSLVFTVQTLKLEITRHSRNTV